VVLDFGLLQEKLDHLVQIGGVGNVDQHLLEPASEEKSLQAPQCHAHGIFVDHVQGRVQVSGL
jgi:hypothetical protein